MNDAKTLGRLDTAPAVGRPDLLAPPVVSALAGFAGADGVFVAPIDPDLADTAAFCAAYDVPLSASANCVVVTGKRAGEQRWAAAVVLATTRADVNNVVRRRMDVRKVSFAAMADAVAATGMEYGGITPIGLPAVVETPLVIPPYSMPVAATASACGAESLTPDQPFGSFGGRSSTSTQGSSQSGTQSSRITAGSPHTENDSALTPRSVSGTRRARSSCSPGSGCATARA